MVGEFYGTLRAGYEASALDRLGDVARRLLRGYRRACRPRFALAAGFPSLLDLLQESRAGKMVTLPFDKTQSTNTAGATFSYWGVGAYPTAGVAATKASAAAGVQLTKASAGAFQQLPLVKSGDQLHFVDGWCQNVGAAASILLYDRLWQCDPTLSKSNLDVFDAGNVPRYQSAVDGEWQEARGNFVGVDVSVTLAATAHNANIEYTNQAGTTGKLTSATGISGCVAGRVDMASSTPQWFMNLIDNDTGVKELTGAGVSAILGSGAMWYFIGHPIAWMPSMHAVLATRLEGLHSALNLARVADDACLAMLHVARISGSQSATRGAFRLVSG
jgi:hypothetical protein